MILLLIPAALFWAFVHSARVVSRGKPCATELLQMASHILASRIGRNPQSVPAWA